MKALNYLFFIKTKGTLRKIFSKPLPAILTVGSLLLVVFLLFVSMQANDSYNMINITSVEGMIMMFLGYTFFFLGVMLLQKRTAMVMAQDAHYIFAGPFTRKQTLGYLLVDTVKSSVFIALIAVLYLLMLFSQVLIDPILSIALVVQACTVFYIVFALVTYFYFLDITGFKTKLIKPLLCAIIVVFVGILAFKNIAAANFDMVAGFKAFISDSSFYIIPIFGWMKWGLVAFANGNYIIGVAGLFMNLLAAGILTYLILNVKGDFYERAISDAEYMTEMRDNMRAGKTQSMNTKISEVKNVSFREGAKAISGLHILQMRKTKSWISKKDIGLLLFYLVIAKLIGMNYVFYQYYIMIILLTSISSDSIISELKKHYVYIIPDKPLQKMMHLVIPIIGRMSIVILFASVVGGLLFQASILDILLAFVMLFGYIVLFVAGNVWSLKIMKSANNVVVEQLMKTLIIILAMVPAILLTLGCFFLIGPTMENLNVLNFISTIMSLVCNILIGFLMILSAKSMLSGSNLMSD